MRAYLSILQKRFAYFLLSAFAIGSLASCQKEGSDYPDIPASGLMAYNLAPDLPAVGFSIGTVPISGVLGYTAHMAGYVPVEAGNRQVGAFDANGGAAIASQTAAFLENAQYSTFLIGHNGQYRTVLALDNNGTTSRVSGKAWIRYINAVVGNTATADVNIAGQTEAASYGAVSDFRQVDPGSVTVKISTDNFETSRTILLEQNKLYTVMFVGMPGATDPQLALQARFAVSGTTN